MKKIILHSMLMLCALTLANAQPSSQTIDNAVQGTGLNQHNYVGAGWVHGSSVPNFYNGTLSYSNVAGAYVTFTFVGNIIEWYTEKKNTHGIAAVSIDGGAETIVDLYWATMENVLAYRSPILSHGTHTFKIRVTGTKNAASTGFYVIHDYFKALPAATTSLSDSSSTFAGVGSGVGTLYGYPPFHNTGFGYKTLGNNNGGLNGSQNTAVGSNALRRSSGTQNTAVGFQALPDGSTSNFNTAVGSLALYTGVYNLPDITHGDFNTAIGTASGPSVGNLSNTTALGSNAKVTASNQVRIGNSFVTSIGGQVSWSTLSDGRFKRDLREDVSGLEFVNNLRPVSYTVDKTSMQKFLRIPESVSQSSLEAKEKPIRQTGFVAQEVEALVKKSGYVFSGVDAPKNDKDPYTIRYAEFVVPLVKAVQELSAKNEEQQKQIDLLLTQLGEKEKGISELQSSEISLLQNNPNPFSANTEIKMVLPESAINANIMVYNLEGKQLKELQVKARGKASVTILGNELSAGMYIYALIVDGKVVDTKRMILTK